MSDFRAALQINFINRRTGSLVSTLPAVNSITLNKDIRQFTDTFDFDIEYRFADKIDLASHDFVEFYFLLNNQKFQVGCGFIEDLVKETGDNILKFQANGRDFLGQFMNVPFLSAAPFRQTSLISFLNSCINQSYYSQAQQQNMYLAEYLGLKGLSRKVVDLGAEPGSLVIPQVSDSMMAPVIQSMADEAYNIVYQNRFGQAVIWGRASLDANTTGLSLTDTSDINVKHFTVRQNYSKVISESKVLITSGEGSLDYAATPSNSIFNSDQRARQIFQPRVQVFQNGSLVTTAGVSGSYDVKKDKLAKSILRKSNQNLSQVLIQATYPYFVDQNNNRIPYEVNQVFNIKSVAHSINEPMRLAGISYRQSADSLTQDLLFIPKDSLV